MHTRRTGATLLALLLSLALALPALAQPAAEGPPTEDPAISAQYAGGYLARAIGPDGALPETFAPVGEEIDVALALAIAGVGADALARVVAFVEAEFETYVAPGEDPEDIPGRLGKVALLAAAVGLDPTAFGPEETDLVARIVAGQQEPGEADEGMYGEPDPFGAVVNHSYAVLGLVAAEAEVDLQPAVDWLLDQQCPEGGWKGYRRPQERQADNCFPEFEGGTGTGEGTDPTAFALHALAGAALAGETVPGDVISDGLDYLDDIQNDDGGWGWQEGEETNANSTAVVIQAIVALGPNNAGELADWATEDGDPLTALRTLQAGCDAPGPQRGGFAYVPDEDGGLTPTTFATSQAVWGIAQAPFPVQPRQVADAEPFPACPLASLRLDGPTRIDTAAAIARDAYPDGADTVVVAFAFEYADALAGAPLAAAEDAPILLSERDRLSPVAAETIAELEASTVILLGGTAALAAEVEEQTLALEGVEEVDRVFGPNRFATAAAVAERLDADAVYITEGVHAEPHRGWPDALAVSALAAFEARPILLVTAGALPRETQEALDGYDEAVVVGGEQAVGAAVFAAIDEEVDEVARVSGANRFATAVAVAERAREAGMDPTSTWFATGASFADALAAGPAVAARGDLLLLVAGTAYANSPATATYVRDLGFTIDEIRVVGGTGVMTADTLAALEADARAEAR